MVHQIRLEPSFLKRRNYVMIIVDRRLVKE